MNLFRTKTKFYVSKKIETNFQKNIFEKKGIVN